MKRIKIIFLALLTLSSMSNIFAKQAPVEEPDLYDFNNIVSNLSKACAPEILDNYIIFTQNTGPRFVGIAFDFENYSVIHPFQIHINRDFEGKETSSVMFYILERPEKISEITYRLIIDGLWTRDPMNQETKYDFETGITLSYLDIGEPLPEVTNAKNSDLVKFIYNGESGLQVRLGGNFTNWDSWIYELTEIRPGYYELEMALPEGTYYYNYYLGMNSIVDKTNPNRAYTDDGRVSSVLEVK